MLQRQADLLREDEQYLTGITNELVRTLVSHHSRGVQRVDHQAFVELPVALQRRLVRIILRTYDEEGRASSLQMVESVRRILVKGRSGARLSFKKTFVVLEQGSVRFSPSVGGDRSHQIDSAQKKRERHAVPVPSTASWAGTNQQIHVQLMTRRAVDQLGRSPSRGLALFDADRFTEPLVVRAWQVGDRFFPHGMKGRSKKLQNFFTDRKVARHERGTIPLLVAPEGILWVVGMRQDERFVVCDGTTRCLVVSVSNRPSEEE